MDKMFLSVKEAQKAFGISCAKMYELTRQKDFPVVRIDRRVLIPVTQLETWIAKQSEAATLKDE